MSQGLFAPGDVLLDIAFDASVIEWRGPAPFYFLAVPQIHSDTIRWAARTASYGWGCVPVDARIGDIAFTTSLFPRGAAYLLPLKVAVRRRAHIADDAVVNAAMRITAPA